MNYEYKYYLYKKKYLDLKGKLGGARLPTAMEIIFTGIKIYLSNIGMPNEFITGNLINWGYYKINFFPRYDFIDIKIFGVSEENLDNANPNLERMDLNIDLSNIILFNRILTINITRINKINIRGDNLSDIDIKYVGTDNEYNFYVNTTGYSDFYAIDDNELDSITDENFKNMFKLLKSFILYFHSELKKNGMINNQININN